MRPAFQEAGHAVIARSKWQVYRGPDICGYTGSALSLRWFEYDKGGALKLSSRIYS